VNVEGYVEGDLYGSERVSIRKSAQVRGKITSPRVSLEEGAKYKGSIEMDPETVDASLGTRRNASPKGASVATGASAGAASSGPAKLNGDGLDKSSGGAVKDSAAKRGTVG
jgi:cytoskeletal protein CcmA (bactofilin family)